MADNKPSTQDYLDEQARLAEAYMRDYSVIPTYCQLAIVPLAILLGALGLFNLMHLAGVSAWVAAIASVPLGIVLVWGVFVGMGVVIEQITTSIGWPELEKRILELGLPDDTRDKAIRCFKEALNKDREASFYDASAPVVMLFVLPFISRKAQKLPDWLSKFDNDVSINGDSGIVKLGGGRYIHWRDKDKHPEINIEGFPHSNYRDDDYEGDCYYARGFHPHGFVARYIWLGFRNRASKASQDLGIKVDGEIHVIAGSPEHSQEQEGFCLRRYQDYFQYDCHTKVKMFGRYWAKRMNIGYKLGIAQAFPDKDKLVMPVAILWSLKKWKGD